MLTITILAVAVAAGAPWVLIGAVLLAVVSPGAFLAVVAVSAARHAARRRSVAGPDAEASFLRGLAAELAAGASVRAAIVAAADRAPSIDLSAAVRLAGAGMSADRIGRSIGSALSWNGVAAAAAFRLAASTGGPVGPVFDALARRAEEHGRLARERRALTAQARLSAWIVGGGPVVLVVLGLVAGVGPDLGDLGPAGWVVVSVGLGLITFGAAAVWLMMRRAQA